jgi:hypothetical protein
MKLEDEPITDDESLLRRVWRDRFRTDSVPVISPGAFEPRWKGRDIDSDGISLYRSACLNHATDILAGVADDKRPSIAIVRMSVGFLKSLGLSVVCRPRSAIPGHVVIPELSADHYKTEKGKFTPILKALADEASKEENIVRRPDGVGRASMTLN